MEINLPPHVARYAILIMFAQTWREILAQYEKAFADLESRTPVLRKREDFFYNDLPSRLKGRFPQYLTLEEYNNIKEWVALRHAKSPEYVPQEIKIPKDQLADFSFKVEDLTRQAFEALSQGDFMKSMLLLFTLEGCDLTTGTAILSVVDDAIPVFSPEFCESLHCIIGSNDDGSLVRCISNI